VQKVRATQTDLLRIIILYMLQKAKRKPHGNNLYIEIYLTVERTEFFNVHLLHYRLHTHNEYFHKSNILNDSYNRHNGRRAARLRCCLLHKVIVFIRATRLCGQVAIRCVVIFSLSWLDSEIAIRRYRTRFATNNWIVYRHTANWCLRSMIRKYTEVTVIYRDTNFVRFIYYT